MQGERDFVIEAIAVGMLRLAGEDKVPALLVAERLKVLDPPELQRAVVSMLDLYKAVVRAKIPPGLEQREWEERQAQK